MNFLSLAPTDDMPMLYLGIGCILMAILGGFTSEFNLIVSVRQFFGIFIRSIFIGLIAFFSGISLKMPWWVKITMAGIFGFIGIPSVLIISKKIIAGIVDTFKNIDDVIKDTELRSSDTYKDQYATKSPTHRKKNGK